MASTDKRQYLLWSPFCTQHILNSFGETVAKVSSLICYIVPGFFQHFAELFCPHCLCDIHAWTLPRSVHDCQGLSASVCLSIFTLFLLLENVVSRAVLIALASRWSCQRLSHILAGPLLLPFVVFDLNWSFRLFFFFFLQQGSQAFLLIQH